MIEDDVKNIESPVLRAAAEMLIQTAEKIYRGECPEESVSVIMAKAHPSKHGYVSQDEVMNVDDSCRELGLRYNRKRFYEIIKPYGIKQFKLNNQSCGYLKEDIYRIKKDIQDGKIKN